MTVKIEKKINEKIVAEKPAIVKKPTKIIKKDNKKVNRVKAHPKKDLDWDKLIEDKINKILSEKLEDVIEKIFAKYIKTKDNSNLNLSC